MGLILALMSSFAFALDTTLMAKPYRSINTFLALGMRGAAIAVTGTILLILVPVYVYQDLLRHLPYLFLAGLTAAVANWGYAKSTQYFPVGIANASVLSLQVMVTSSLGYLFFQEHLNLYTICIIILILLLNTYVSVQNYSSDYEFKKSMNAGVLFLLTNGMFQSCSFFLLAKTSRELNPFLSAYIWEISIGVFCLLAAFITPNKKTESFNLSNFKSIIWRSFPTVPAVALYAWATTLAPLAIIQTVFSAVALFAAMIGSFLYKEYLTKKQIIALICLIALIASLKCVS